jgi:hypothetical protein
MALNNLLGRVESSKKRSPAPVQAGAGLEVFRNLGLVSQISQLKVTSLHHM